MKLNPYVEILARALYLKDTSHVPFPPEDLELAKDAVKFMNCRTYLCRFSVLHSGHIGVYPFNYDEFRNET